MTTPEQLETRMLRDRAAVRDEQLAQAQENALMLYQALAKHAPDALAEIKPHLHANIRELDKVVCEVTAAREEAARLRREVDALKTEIDAGLGDNEQSEDMDETPLAWYVRDTTRQIEECGLAIAALKERERDEKAETELRDQRVLLVGLVNGLIASLYAAE